LPWFGEAAADHPEVGLDATGVASARAETRLSRTFRAFRHRNYRVFYIGQAISLSGTWMQTIAMSWLVLDLTDSKAALGFVTFLQFIPITIFSLYAGVIADRIPKRDLLLACRLIAMAQSVALALLVATGAVELWMVYVLAVVLGLSNAFEQPTRQAFTVELVGRDDLLNAVALNSGLFNGARLVGPAVGGVVIAALGVAAAFAINAVSYIPTIWALLAMNMAQLHATAPRPPEEGNSLAQFKEGLAYAFRTPATLFVIIMAVFLGCFGFNFIVVLPLVARYVLDGDSVVLGFLTASLGLGALISALVLAGRQRPSARGILMGGTAFTVLLAGVAASEWIVVTMVALLMLGMALTAFAAGSNTFVQLATPDHLRGRVMGLWMLLLAGSTPIGGGLTGLVAEQFGVQAALGLNAAMCGIGVLLGGAYYFTHREAIRESRDSARSQAVAA
jgi:MFS family permease